MSITVVCYLPEGFTFFLLFFITSPPPPGPPIVCHLSAGKRDRVVSVTTGVLSALPVLLVSMGEREQEEEEKGGG